MVAVALSLNSDPNHVHHQPQFAKIPYPSYFKFQYGNSVLRLTHVSSTAMCSKELVMKQATQSGHFSEKTLDFFKKVMERSGLGDSTYLAEVFFEKTYDPSMKAARREIEMSIFGSVDMLLAKTGVRCEDIGILILQFDWDGCSAGILAMDLLKQLLQVHKNSYAMIISTESITENCYIGKERSKFLINCLFRVGGAAILLSNHSSNRHISKYELLHAVHTNTSSSDRSYNCILREEDSSGIVGISINKDLLHSAISTIEPNLTALGHLILPVNEKFTYVINYIARRIIPAMNIHPYVPNYSKAVNHFLPHVGGKPVLDELQKTLGFSDDDMEASRMTLYRYGNTSSSSIWYELAYVEAKGRVKKGDRAWQIAFGSGFKCNSIVWRAIRTVDRDEYNPWTDEIDGFPVTSLESEPMPVFFAPSK
ncbi:3-ketoacyl-CoA synthase 11-like protein [Tanacetum coccineum]